MPANLPEDLTLTGSLEFAVAKYLIVEGSRFRGLGDKWH